MREGGLEWMAEMCRTMMTPALAVTTTRERPMRFAGTAVFLVCAWCFPILGAAQDAVEINKIADTMVLMLGRWPQRSGNRRRQRRRRSVAAFSRCHREPQGRVQGQ